MLFDLKKKHSFPSRVSHFGAGLAPAFNPLLLTTYHAGYLMNFTNSIKPGTIDPVLINKNWYSTKDLTGAIQLLRPDATTSTKIVNGYEVQEFGPNVTNRFRNSSSDLMNGITDFTMLIGFQGVPGAVTRYLFTIRSQTPYLNLYFNVNTLGIASQTGNDGVGHTIINASVLNSYSDGNFHAAVLVYNQTTKTFTMYTDLNEVVASSNALFVPKILTPNNDANFQLGLLQSTVSAFWSPGSCGDILIFNAPLAPSVCQQLLAWEKTRLGI